MPDRGSQCLRVVPRGRLDTDGAILVCARLGHRDLPDPSAAASAQRHAARVDGYALKPRVETIEVEQARQLPPHGDECLLSRVGGIGFVAQDYQAQSVHGIHPASHQRLEGGRISSAGEVDQRTPGKRLVHRLPPWQCAWCASTNSMPLDRPRFTVASAAKVPSA
jgi:hypothetical protein